MYDIYTLLNDILLESGRFIFIAAAMLLGIFLGKKLRDFRDAKKESDDKTSFDAENK